MSQNIKYALILIGLGAIAAFLAYKPSTASVAKEISVDEDGTVHYGDHQAHSEWGEPGETIDGIVTINERQVMSQYPMTTNDLVVTTGVFSDPEKVQWKAKAGRLYSASGDLNGKGSFTFVTIIPASPAAAEQLAKVAIGDDITLRGRVSTTGTLSAPGQPTLHLPAGKWKIMLLEEVEAYAPPKK